MMMVPPCDDNKVGKSGNQIPNPYSHSYIAFHDSDSREEIAGWIMKPMVKTNFPIPQDDVIIHNSSLKSDLDFCYPLSSTCHDSLYCDFPVQSAPPASFSQSLDFRVTGSNCDKIEGRHIT